MAPMLNINEEQKIDEKLATLKNLEEKKGLRKDGEETDIITIVKDTQHIEIEKMASMLNFDEEQSCG